jgi:hypothetical protein
MELLGSIATYAPQVVMNVLDLVIDSAEIKNKDEWVSRIRKLNGQRDPKKPPTPEEMQKGQKDAADEAQAKAIQLETLQAQLEELKAKTAKLDAGAILTRVESMFTALQAAQVVAMTPTVAPVADTIAAGAGFQDQQGQDPNLPMLPEPAAPVAPPPIPGGMTSGGIAPAMAPQAPPDSATGLAGSQQGIETPTGADNGPVM